MKKSSTAGNNEKLSKLVIRDPLTATYNRRWFFAQLDAEISRSKRHQHTVSIALIDLDNFKSVNNSFDWSSTGIDRP